MPNTEFSCPVCGGETLPRHTGFRPAMDADGNNTFSPPRNYLQCQRCLWWWPFNQNGVPCGPPKEKTRG